MLDSGEKLSKIGAGVNDVPGSPMYVKLKLALMNAIDTGIYAPGERLPSESELGRQCSISRTTVVRAMIDLEKAGYVVRRQGIGTFARERKIEKVLFALEGFTEEMRRSSHSASSNLLSFVRSQCTPDHAQLLGLSSNAEVYVVRRIRLADRRPAVLEHLELPAELFPSLESHFDPSCQSLYDLMKRVYGIQVASAEFTVEAANLSAAEARVLKVRRNDAVLLVSGVSFDELGRPVEWNRSLYPGSLYRFVGRSSVPPSSDRSGTTPPSEEESPIPYMSK